MTIENVKDIIRKDILCFLPLIQEEYKISSDKILPIKKHTEDCISFSRGTISFFVREGKIYYPLDAIEVFETFPKKKSFSSTFHGVSFEDYLTTNTTYFDYIHHVIADGLTVIDYYRESTLHELLHLCGGSGGSPLEEGFNELKTRELAQKYGIRIAAVGYQKEVEIAKEMQSIFGVDTINKITFLPIEERREYLYCNFGMEALIFYDKVRHSMEKESKSYASRIQTIRNPFYKAELYSKIHYPNTWNIIENYKNNRK
ncbi:MAG: hypothetical protein IJ193_01070 [Bacilli bacterium]|nr:hypothetical protein [Bacilli bacterium]